MTLGSGRRHKWTPSLSPQLSTADVGGDAAGAAALASAVIVSVKGTKTAAAPMDLEVGRAGLVSSSPCMPLIQGIGTSHAYAYLKDGW